MQPAPLPNGPAAVPRFLAALARMRRAQAWVLVLACMDLAALGDLATGPDLWFGPVYLVVICLAAWSLGWGAGQAAGVACMALTFAINGISLYPYGSAALPANFAMRFAAASLVVAVIAAMRRAYLREWYLARTDALTVAFNRQAFFELGAGLCAGRGWRLLVYADLDGLKAINDNRGHAAGDACLRLYASGVRKTIRRDDLFARVGGDEFVLFMTVRDEAAARLVAGRLHRRMNGIAGHAGLFSTADDLSVFARMLLAGGRWRGARVLAPLTVAKMTRPATPPDMLPVRGLGWDLDTGFSSPRGELFPMGSFGHTGFTGTSLWIDPERGTWAVLLANRTFAPRAPNRIQALRRIVNDRLAEAADLAAAD